MLPNTARSGTTLFELCIGVALIGILATMAIPSINRAQLSFGLDGSAHEVRSELHRARILAIMRNEDCRLRVTSGTEYRIGGKCVPAMLSARTIAPSFIRWEMWIRWPQ